jgi:polysaccharide chain length determinant protein (PEP-CTERM system associated)
MSPTPDSTLADPQQIIADLDLYGSLRQKLPMEEVVQRMRADITVQLESSASNARNKDSASFRILYVSNEAATAQRTTERLASLFIEENIRDRANISEDTNRFLEAQLLDARRRLEEQEKKLEQYRLRYSGELPSQASANLQAIQNVQMQLQSLREASDRARERRLLVERQLADLQSPDPVVASVPPPAPATGQAGAPPTVQLTTAQQLEAARQRLGVLATQFTPAHPDVQNLRRTIRELEVKAQEEARQPSPSEAAPVNVQSNPPEVARQKRIRDLKLQMEDVDRELADKQQQEKELRSLVADYQAKLDAVPTRESDLVELTRDYNTLQTTYQSLLGKREESNLASSLERRSIGEQFRILDPARVPERPFSPNKIAITLGGAGGGLVLGLLLIGFGEYRDSTFKVEQEVTRLCQLPVLAFVPLMLSASERRARQRRACSPTPAVFVTYRAFASTLLHQVVKDSCIRVLQFRELPFEITPTKFVFLCLSTVRRWPSTIRSVTQRRRSRR